MLNSSSPVALYEQLKLLIENDILNGVYKPGDKLPNENKLAENYDVSRITVRRAIKELEEKELVEIRRGKGTFVKEPTMDIMILNLGGFKEVLSSNKHNVEEKVLMKKLLKPDKKIAKALKLSKGSKVLKLKRLILDEGEPLSVDISYFPKDIYPNIWEKIKDNISTFKLIKEDYGMKMDSVHKEFSVITGNEELSDLLNCSSIDPLFKVEKVIYDIADNPIHFSTYYIIANRVKYFIKIDNMLKDN